MMCGPTSCGTAAGYGAYLLCGLAELALLWMGVMLVTADGRFSGAAGMLLLCVTAAFFQNFWAVQAAVDIPFAVAAKNAWLLCLLRPGMTVLGLGVNALLLIPAVLFSRFLCRMCCCSRAVCPDLPRA